MVTSATGAYGRSDGGQGLIQNGNESVRFPDLTLGLTCLPPTLASDMLKIQFR